MPGYDSKLPSRQLFSPQPQANNAELFHGIGSIGVKRRFRWSGVAGVRLVTRRASKGGTTTHILLWGDQDIRLGVGLTSERRGFVLAAPEQLHHEREVASRMDIRGR